MADLTESRDTREIMCNSMKFRRELSVNGTIHIGAMVALNADGEAVKASDAANLIVVGRADDIVNGQVKTSSGVFIYNNEDLTVADINKQCYVKDDNTVQKAGTAIAGVVRAVYSDDTVAVEIGNTSVVVIEVEVEETQGV